MSRDDIRTEVMPVRFTTPFICDDVIRPYLRKVFCGEYDLEVHLPGHLKIIDLGANYGAFSCWASYRWPDSEILAYEPHPETFKYLQMNMAIHPNVKVFNYGIGVPGWRVLSNGRYNCGENSFHAMTNNPNPTGLHAEVRDPSELPDCDIMKLDIEGCEVEVLTPYIKSGKRPKLILFEYHSHSILKRLMELLLDDYIVGGSIVENITGRGVLRLVRKDLLS